MAQFGFLIKIVAFGQTFPYRPKFECLSKFLIFDQNLNFRPNRFLLKFEFSALFSTLYKETFFLILRFVLFSYGITHIIEMAT